MLNLDGYVRKHTEITLGSKEFTFSELSLADLGAFLGYTKEQLRKAQKERSGEIIAYIKELGLELTPEVILEKVLHPLTDEEVEEYMSSFEGVTYAAYLSMKSYHPGATLEEVANLIQATDMDKVTAALGLGDDGDGKKKMRVKPPKKQSVSQ